MCICSRFIHGIRIETGTKSLIVCRRQASQDASFHAFVFVLSDQYPGLQERDERGNPPQAVQKVSPCLLRCSCEEKTARVWACLFLPAGEKFGVAGSMHVSKLCCRQQPQRWEKVTRLTRMMRVTLVVTGADGKQGYGEVCRVFSA